MTTPTKKPNPVDTTIGDIHRTRERISDTFSGDIRAISEDAMRRQAQSGRRTVSYAACEENATPSQDKNTNSAK